MLTYLPVFIIPFAMVLSEVFNIITGQAFSRQQLLHIILGIEPIILKGKPAITFGWIKVVFGILFFIVYALFVFFQLWSLDR